MIDRKCIRCDKGFKIKPSDLKHSPCTYCSLKCYWKATRSYTYNAIHKWIHSRLGKATYCSVNPKHKSKRYEWSSISRKYKRDLKDYRQLCLSCHRKYDMTKKIKAKISKTLKGKYYGNREKSIAQFIPPDHYIERYDSIIQASRKSGIGYPNIIRALKSQKYTAGGYKWVYAELVGSGDYLVELEE